MPSDRVVFTNVSVLTCSGEEPFAGEVLVDAHRIVKISRSPRTVPHDDARVVDGGGATLMPGLVESHTHLSINNTGSLAGLGAIPPEEHTLITMHNARLYLDFGITSCISAGSVKPRLDLVIRNAINAGEIPGPRILASSPWLSVTGGLGDIRLLHLYRESLALMADSPDEFRRLTRELIREGVDIIKLVVSGDTGMPHARSTDTLFTEAELAAVAEVVHRQGRRMSAHARSAESVKMCVRHGVKLIYHCNFADEEGLDMLEANRDWVFVSPNLGFPAVAVYEGAAWGLTDEAVAEMGFQEELDSAIKTMVELRRRGLRVLGGGDYGFTSTPHGNNARDIEHFVNFLGFSPMEAIYSMTRWGGEAMDRGHELGQVKEGYLADLLLVDGDPLAQPGLLRDRDRLLAIMKDGAFHKEPAPAHSPAV